MMATGEGGFSLIESVIAVALLAVGVSALAQLVIVSARASASVQHADAVQQAARERMEQLRALAWTSDNGGMPITDATSDLTVTPGTATGGLGLALSPGDTLLSNVAGFCDFLDINGQWITGGPRPPVGAAWVRRWSVVPLSLVADTLLLQVVVVPARLSGASAAMAARGTNGAWLVAVRTRRSR
jgi:prepilin-type N-terminal cleavage/methylation domain-containing protein